MGKRRPADTKGYENDDGLKGAKHRARACELDRAIREGQTTRRSYDLPISLSMVQGKPVVKGNPFCPWQRVHTFDACMCVRARKNTGELISVRGILPVG